MEEKKKSKPSPIEQWEKYGAPCYYVRFQQPIPRHLNDEPVSEFQVSDNRKYGVQSVTYTEHGVIWRNKDELNICALANVMYARTVVK
jgi:hypothetical protein